MTFSKPKIFIPKEKNAAGILKPSVAKGKYWYVKYSYRNPKTGKMEKFKEKAGINRHKTVTMRKMAIRNLRIAVEQFLALGYSPFEYRKVDLADKKEWTTEEALENAITEKHKVWSASTININKFPINVFIRYLKKHNLYQNDIKTITKRHVILFLNNLGKDKGKPVNATTRNTYRKTISSLFNQMVADDIIDKNFVEGIPKLASKPKKNIPFRKKEMETIKEHLLEHDPYLYFFIKFVMYGFFRPVEVCRIKIKDINIDRNTISVQSKTEDATANTVFLTKQLKETIAEMDLHKFDTEYHLFSSKLEPSNWLVEDTVKRTYFGRRFAKVKKALNFDENYGIYSFRHTAAIDIFTTYKEQGLTDLEAKHKMLPITRHKTVDSLNKYLRDIGASLPEDYSDDYSLDF
ncbi:tyrosine-type recombinase/integrase [Polaribacter sp. Z014]|uniref:tyrosine-type recombinase/integrase n=1 Tax=Polaribacter sp. Z014 TaxID=2927126 RepID=UPI002020D104|nr:site-specific integrase [Polaribacter sp. Z014]MCL7764436.1 tyrosine-type recombinase/integrase [Polaribacter sp. Z014]